MHTLSSSLRIHHGSGARWALWCVLGLCGVLGAAGLAVLVTAGPWWTVAGGAVLLATLATCLASPFAGLCITVVTLIISTSNLYYVVVDTLQLHLYPYYFPLFFTCLGMLAQSRRQSMQLAPASAFMPVLLLALVGEILSLVWAPHVAWGVANIVRLVLNIMLYWCVLALCTSARRLDLLLKTVLWTALMTSLGVIAALEYEYSLHGYLSPKLVLELHFYTIRAGGIESWNQSAGWLVVASIIAAGYAVLATTRLRRAAWAIAAMYFYCIMLYPASRGALLGFIGAVELLVLLLPATRYSFMKKSTLFVVVMVAGIFITTPSYIDRIMVGFGYTGELLFSEKQADPSGDADSDATGLSTRFKIWKEGFRAMMEEPSTLVTGLGAGGFTYHVKVFEIHNVYLAFLYDMGLAGVFLLQLACFIFVRRTAAVCRAYHSARHAPDFVQVMFYALLTAVAAEVGIHGIVDYDLTSFVSRYAFFYLALYDVALRLARVQLGQEPSQA